MLKTIDILARAKELVGKRFKCTKSIVNTSLKGQIAKLELFENDGEPYYGLSKEGCKISLTGFEEWEEVQEPVDVMEAIKAYDGGKTIYCIFRNRRFTYSHDISSLLESKLSVGFQAIGAEEILNGEWYIKEEGEK